MNKKQKLFVQMLIVAGSLVVVVSAVYLMERFCRLRYAENLILREGRRSESFWDVINTERGHLFRVRNGKFRGWYLAADDLVNSHNYSPLPGFGLPGPRLQGPQVRNLILRDRPGRDCYFKVTEEQKGARIQTAGGRYRGWYLHLLPDYVPDTGRNPRTAWNLILLKQDRDGEAFWNITRTTAGHIIQATATPFGGWYLDALLKANILERNICWGEENRRDGPSPPLAR